RPVRPPPRPCRRRQPPGPRRRRQPPRPRRRRARPRPLPPGPRPRRPTRRPRRRSRPRRRRPRAGRARLPERRAPAPGGRPDQAPAGPARQAADRPGSPQIDRAPRPVAPRTAPRRPRGISPVIAASADAGSNSVHLFVAVVAGHRLEPLLDESAFLGLGGVVDERGRLGRNKRAELASTLSRFAGIARDLGAATTTFVATEPLRRAKD